MAKVDHYCSWCNKFLFSEERNDFKEDTITHGMCEVCELKLLQDRLPQMESKLQTFRDMKLEEQAQIIAKRIEKMIERMEELKSNLQSNDASDSLSPVSLMRLSQIDDPDELLKNHKKEDIVVEEKLDGWKAQVIKSAGKIKIYSRKGEDKTENFPQLVDALKSLPDGTLVEGELVYWHNNKQDVGKVTSVAGSNPDTAQEKAKKLPGVIKLHLYDVLWAKGKNVSDKPFSERRKILSSIVKPNNLILITKQYPFSKWQDAMNKAVKEGGEGIVLKIKDKSYEYKAKGQSEPKPKDIMFKYKGGVGKSDSDDYVVYDYKISDKGKLKAYFGQYYKGKLYHISEISNFSKEDEQTIKNKLKKGHFVIEIGFQERVPGGLRHQKFIRFRDDKKPKDATMNEFHVKHLDNFNIVKKSSFKLSKRAEFLSPSQIIRILQPSSIVTTLEKNVRQPEVPSDINFDLQLAFRIISQLESGNKSWIHGDSGNSFGLTQVHGPYFMNWLARNPQLQSKTGIDPNKLRVLADDWKKNLRKLVRDPNLWQTVPVDQNAVKAFISLHPQKVVRRREGLTIKMNPNNMLGVVKRIGGRYIGKQINIPLLKEKYGFDPTPINMSKLQQIMDTYVTPRVAVSAIAQLITSQNDPITSSRFYNTFSQKNIRNDKDAKYLTDWASKSDFMSRINSVLNDVVKYKYNTNAPGAYNMYQLVALANNSGTYRVRRFLKNKSLFTAGNLHYLQRANPYIQRVTGLPTNVIEGGLAGFPDIPKEKRFAFLRRLAQLNMSYQEQASKIVEMVRKWLVGETDLSKMEEYGVKYIGKSPSHIINTVLVFMDKKDVENLLPFMPKTIGNYNLSLQYSPTYEPVPMEYVPRSEEFEEEKTVVDPLREIGTKYYHEILQDYEWYKAHMDEVVEDLRTRYGRDFTEEEVGQAIVNTILKKYEHLISKSEISGLLQKWASYIEPGILYFPDQYAEDIKQGKRSVTIRPADVNVQPGETVRCKTYSGSDIADVTILAKKIMSIPRLEKAHGKTVARALTDRFGPHKRFVVVEFELPEINEADDDEKMSEVLIDKDKKLTRGQIQNHYMKPEVRKKIMSRIKGKPILVYIGTGKNENILKRNHNDKEIIITNDDPKNDDNPNNYFYWVKRRLLSIHQVFGPKTDLGFVDLDLHGNFPFSKAKKYAQELAGKLKSKYHTTPTIYQSGGSGIHVEFKLSHEMSTDKLRGELKDLLNELNEKWDDVTTGIVKGNGMRSDVSTLHNKGGIRVPGSFGETNGNIKKVLGSAQEADENNYLNAPLWETKYDYNDPEVPFPEGNIIQVAPPQGRSPYSQHGAYNTVDDNFILSKRFADLKKKTNRPYKEYIWIWDNKNQKIIYNLNINNGETQENAYDHLSLADEYNIPLGFGDNDYRGYVFFFKGEPKGEVHLYNGNPSIMPDKLRQALEALAKDQAPEFKKMDVPQGTVSELWKQKEKERQLEQHMEKRRWMGFEESDPKFIEDLNYKFASAKKKIAFLIAPKDFYEPEYFTPRRVFAEKYSFVVDIISSKDMAKGAQGTEIKVDKNISKIKSKNYDALFVCGGKGMIEFSKNKEAQELIRSFYADEKPMALICHAPLLIAKTGLIHNCEITGWPDIQKDIEHANGIWTGMPIERSGLFFTAVGPDEAEDLAHVLSNFLLGEKTLIPAQKKLLNWKKAQERIQTIWKMAEDDDEIARFWAEHPELQEEEEEEDEQEEGGWKEEKEKSEQKLAPKPFIPPTIEREEEEGAEEEKEEEPREEKKIENIEKQLPEDKPKYIGFKHIVKPEEHEELEQKPEEEEMEEEGQAPEELEDFSNIFDTDGDLDEKIIEEYKDIEEEQGEAEEDFFENKTPIFGSELTPPTDKKGNILDRWFEPKEIERPFMPAQVKALFAPENMKDGPSLTKLFQNPDAWEMLKNNPEIAQKWVLPAIIMGVGKKWFDNNSTQLKLGARGKDVGLTPFGMFSEADIDLVRNQHALITELPSSKAYISMINELITEFANKYFSFGYRADEKGSVPLGGYIYKALSREMSKRIAADRGYKEIRVPICSYCKSRKQKRQSKEVVYHGMEYIEGSKPRQWICAECKRNFEENQARITALSYDLDNKTKHIGRIQSKLTQIKKIEAPTVDIKQQQNEYEKQIVLLANEIKDIRGNLDNLNKIQYSLEVHIQGVPYWHTWCPNPNCPGNRVPLTAIDKSSDFWKTEAGIKAMDVLQKRFGITIKPTQQADEDGNMPRILPHRIPPEEILDVPFICPHDYVKFTLRSARGKGLQKKGGFFWEPWQHMMWDRIAKEEISIDEDRWEGIEADQEDIIHNETVQKTSLYLSKLGAKLFSDQYTDAIKEYNNWFTKQVEIYKEKGLPVLQAVKKVEQSTHNGARQRLLSMYQTLGETSHLDPGMFIAWLAELDVENKFIADRDGDLQERNMVQKIKAKDRRDNIYIPTLHAWVSKMMDSREDWFEHYKMGDILANNRVDGIYSNGPGTFFIAKIGDEILGEDEDLVFGFNCNLTPAHRQQTKSSPFSYRPSKEETEKWTLPSGKNKKIPLRSQSSINPKVLKFIGLWKIPESQLAMLHKHPEWLNGSTSIPINNNLVQYAKSHPEENLSGEIMYSDYYRVALNGADTSFGMGEYVLVQALVMPGKYNPEPVVDIRNIRNKSDTHKQIFSKVGALMNEKYIDPESKALLKEFFEDIQNYGDDPEEMRMAMEDLIMGFEQLHKKKASFCLSKRAKDPLSKYKHKRKFDETPEPSGETESGKNKHRFVIQKHDAEKSKTHYDLRLENDKGTMSSWAIPKHKLPGAKEKLLSVKTEDHPISYNKFEGSIPKGEYGAGEVSIHDSGTYEEIEKSKNKIVFKLKGKKEKGTYNLFKTDGNNWLITKHKESDARFPISKRADVYSRHHGKEAYSVEMLIEITSDNKIEQIPVDLLKWNVKEKIWTKGKKEINPEDVLNEPKKYEEEMKRINDADLKYPVLIYDGEIIDGYHRLAKAIKQNKDKIKTVIITDKQLDIARIDKDRIKELK